jgi:hypothetical protein
MTSLLTFTFLAFEPSASSLDDVQQLSDIFQRRPEICEAWPKSRLPIDDCACDIRIAV